MNSELWTVTRFQPWSYKYLCLIFALSDVWYIGEHGNLGNHIFKMAELAIRRKYSWFTIWRYFEHSLALPFFGIGMKTDLFQSCGHCWVFQIGWHIECNTFTASSLGIWNSSTGIPSSPLALFLVMLLKAHLTSHSRMSSSSSITEDSTHRHHQMFNTEIRLSISFSAKDGEALYSQQNSVKLP